MFSSYIVSTTSLLTFCYLSLIGQCLEFSDYNGCVFDLSDSNGITASYNLSKFHLSSDSYEVDDDDVVDWKYRFNVCGRIPQESWDSDIPSFCKSDESTSDPCIKVSDDGDCEEYYNVTGNNAIASAIQINEAHSVCHWMGTELDGLNGLQDYNVSLYDESDSASGIKYSIYNGEWCGTAGYNRKMVIEFICPDSNRYYFNPSDETDLGEEVVAEYPPCVYTVSYESPLACPSDCIAVTDAENTEYAVCSGNGICASDPNAGSVRCLCDDGWSGDLCNVESEYDITIISSGHSGMITAVVICIVLLIIAIGIALYLCHRIRMKEEQISGAHGQFAQSMLDDDGAMVMTDPGTSMGIVSNDSKLQEQQAFDPRINVDPTIQNEIAQQHAKETAAAADNDDSGLLQYGDENENDNDNQVGNGNPNVDDDADDGANEDNDENNDDDGNDNNDNAGDREEADMLGTQ